MLAKNYDENSKVCRDCYIGVAKPNQAYDRLSGKIRGMGRGKGESLSQDDILAKRQAELKRQAEELKNGD